MFVGKRIDTRLPRGPSASEPWIMPCRQPALVPQGRHCCYSGRCRLFLLWVAFRAFMKVAALLIQMVKSSRVDIYIS